MALYSVTFGSSCIVTGAIWPGACRRRAKTWIWLGEQGARIMSAVLWHIRHMQIISGATWKSPANIFGMPKL
jgi:hypothetical protein